MRNFFKIDVNQYQFFRFVLLLQNLKITKKGDKMQTQKRTKCIVYTRVMGYHRPVESFNIGKKGEHKQRTYFLEKKSN